jgi:hypothetical protein
MNIIMLQDDVVTLKEDSDSETPTSSCSGVQPIVSEQNEQLIPLTFSVVESGVEVNYITLTSPIIQTDFGVHPTSYPMGTGLSFPRSKAARV